MDYDSTLHDFITSAMKSGANAVSVLMISSMYIVLKQFFDFIGKHFGNITRDEVIEILDKNMNNPDKAGEEIDKLGQTLTIRAANETGRDAGEAESLNDRIRKAESLYELYLLAISIIIMTLTFTSSILGLEATYKNFKQYYKNYWYNTNKRTPRDREKLKKYWKLAPIFLLLGIGLELLIEGIISIRYNVTPKDFVNYASKTYGAFKIAVLASLLTTIISYLITPVFATKGLALTKNTALKVAGKVFLSSYGVLVITLATLNVVKLFTKLFEVDKEDKEIMLPLQILVSILAVGTSIASAVKTAFEDLRILLRCIRLANKYGNLMKGNKRTLDWVEKKVANAIKKDENIQEYRKKRIIKLVAVAFALIAVILKEFNNATSTSGRESNKAVETANTKELSEIAGAVFTIMALLMESVGMAVLLKTLSLKEIGLALLAGILITQLVTYLIW